MGVIDPMAIGSAAASGVLEFGGWPTAWLALVGILCGAALGIVASVANRWRAFRPALPPLGHAELAALGVSRAK